MLVSHICVFSQYPLNVADEMASRMGIPKTNEMRKYLGFYINKEGRNKIARQKLLEKMNTKLSRWKSLYAKTSTLTGCMIYEKQIYDQATNEELAYFEKHSSIWFIPRLDCVTPAETSCFERVVADAP